MLSPVCWLLAAMAPTACSGDIADGAPGDDDRTTEDPGGNPDFPGESPVAEACQGDVDPGWRPIGRLNRNEYDNTIQDLLGIDANAVAALPAEGAAQGFRNINAALVTDDRFIADHMSLAQAIADKALATGSPARSRIYVCEPKTAGDACVSEIAETLLGRAWRRPPTDGEITALAGLTKVATSDGLTLDDGIEAMVRAALASPFFLFKVEENAGDRGAALGPYELASRLSYFLWASMPDDELLAAAGDGRLANSDDLKKQVGRMLADDKARRFTSLFAQQWLGTFEFAPVVDPKLFPAFTDAVKQDLAAQTTAFMTELLLEGHDIRRMLDADFTYMNDRLATFYDLDVKPGASLKRIDLTDERRHGVMTNGSFLSVTSSPDRTSVTLRGQQILEALLCSPAPPPPDGMVPDLDTSGGENVSLRERLIEHRENPACASCHLEMDSIGFAFENYDAAGRWRDDENGAAIDTSGELIDGTKFDNARELTAVLVKDERLPACFSEKLATYALNRVLQPEDDCRKETIAKQLAAGDHKMLAAIEAIVTDPAFTTHRGPRENELSNGGQP